MGGSEIREMSVIRFNNVPLLGFYSNFLCKRYVNEFNYFRKIIKSRYLRAQKELWELSLHRDIRNGLLMCLKVFLDCLGTI